MDGNYPGFAAVAGALFAASVVASMIQNIHMLSGRKQMRFAVTGSGFEFIPLTNPLAAVVPGLLLLAAGLVAVGGAGDSLWASGDRTIRLVAALLAGFLALLFLVVGGFLVYVVWKPAGAGLMPEGMWFRTPFGQRVITWEALAPGGPPRPPAGWLAGSTLTLAVTRPDLVRQSGWLLGMGAKTAPRLALQYKSHKWLIADAVRWYAEHPHDRPAIGTEEEHTRLLASVSAGSPVPEALPVPAGTPAAGAVRPGEPRPPRPVTVTIAAWLTFAGVVIGLLAASADLVLLWVFGGEMVAIDPETSPAFSIAFASIEVAVALVAGVIAVLLARAAYSGSDQARIGLSVLAGLTGVLAICPCGSPVLGLIDGSNEVLGQAVFFGWMAVRGCIAVIAIATLVLLVVPPAQTYARGR